MMKASPRGLPSARKPMRVLRASETTNTPPTPSPESRLHCMAPRRAHHASTYSAKAGKRRGSITTATCRASRPRNCHPRAARPISRTRGRQPGVDGFRQFFRRHAIRAQPDHMFATDTMPPTPFSLDGNWPERGLGGIDPNLDELPAAPMSVTWYGDRPQDWPDSD